MSLFADTAAILNSIASNDYHGMNSRQISMYLLPEHLSTAIWNRIQNGRRIAGKVQWSALESRIRSGMVKDLMKHFLFTIVDMFTFQDLLLCMKSRGSPRHFSTDTW